MKNFKGLGLSANQCGVMERVFVMYSDFEKREAIACFNPKILNYSKDKNINQPTAVLIVENGDVFWGYGCGSKKEAIGELCFNTSISGYQEILTDPSYAKQIITFTFPHIGIVGVNENDEESVKKTTDSICSELLSNPVIETYNFTIEKI